MTSSNYITYAFFAYKTNGANAYGSAFFENKKCLNSTKVATIRTHIKKLRGVEKGLYRLNHSSELQFRFLTACDAQAAIRRA